MTHPMLTLFGLKWNPFLPNVPVDALWRSPKLDHFCWRLENLVREGGFALITGDPGTGKSVALRLLAHRLASLPDIVTGVLTRPQSGLADFYREMGHLFGVPLAPHNRWGGFKILRDTWLAHVEATRCRPVLLCDEAQEMPVSVLAELRILAATDFDSRSILTVVLCGDTRLTDRFRSEELLPIASRIRARLTLDYLAPKELLDWLEHVLTAAGHAQLLNAEVKTTLAEHAAGNLRVLANMANELLALAARRELRQIDQQLYFELFAGQQPRPRSKAQAAAAPLAQRARA
jgi:type II secretory pathway predicted ATPase ExeA